LPTKIAINGHYILDFLVCLRWNRSHQKANLGLTEEADASTCLIEPIILPCVDFEHELLAPAKFGHYTSKTFLGLFGYPFQINLRPAKPCAVIKDIKWLKNNVSLIWEFLLCANPSQSPPWLNYIIISYIATAQAYL
jgi:hypothetical protein